VTEFAEWWMTTHSHCLRSQSAVKYRERLGRLGALADLPVDSVSAEAVAEWQTGLLTIPRADGRLLAPKTVADTRATVRQLFAAAVDLDVIDRNPVDRVKPPRVERTPGRVLSGEDVAVLIGETDRRLRGRRGNPVHGRPQGQ
jgi:hypothetical protein